MPVLPPDVKTVTALVRDAAAAPSMHNAQPWRFRYLADRHTLQLRADTERAMLHSDPVHRGLHLGCGAALFNLRVAAEHAGLEPRVHLLPDAAEPQLLADVRLTERTSDDAALATLYPAIRRRHTSRYPFAVKDIPETVRAALSEAARLEGARLDFPSPWHAQSLLELVSDAEGRDTLDSRNVEDLVRWTRIGAAEADTATDGVPEYAFGPRKWYGDAPVRDFAARRPVDDRGTVTFENTPHLALLSTAEDGTEDWLRAGQALERVLLLATANDLATSLTSHALEWPDLRWLARDPRSATGFVQMVLRLGYGPEGPATPRRPVGEVLDIQ
ncbi:Acg family FMN-binding oxidoreductase [Streptomyces purpurogeneiscleroticus]|uniref:Acg family FMN-binding oxidoreductase n=1 Tax=Streptomyces purpurogeneiscleroticus TaxID=68259 RepID=UPI001CBEA225|nr:nitroreductase family protein [Streptomyces purpurogeneiscleroticus]MBZ4018763.1 nitroreductase [Streptomyces purpurogeneiscleroticus]